MTGKEFTPISEIEKTNSTKRESNEESSKALGENTPEIKAAEPADIEDRNGNLAELKKNNFVPYEMGSPK